MVARRLPGIRHVLPGRRTASVASGSSLKSKASQVRGHYMQTRRLAALASSLPLRSQGVRHVPAPAARSPTSRRSLAMPAASTGAFSGITVDGARSRIFLKARSCVVVSAGVAAAAAASTKKLPKSLARPRGSLTLRGRPVIGVDEAGRGPWAGPVVAAAVMLAPGSGAFQEGVTDSKKLTEAQREAVFEQLVSNDSVRYKICIRDHRRIDQVNILEATYEAMTECVESFTDVDPAKVLIDGNLVPKPLRDWPCEAVVKGDSKQFLIAAASILAKVTRDRIMLEIDRQHPQYGFNAHKGYGTAAHMTALVKHGPSKVHRLSFEPIKGFLETGKWKKRKSSC